MLSLPLTRTESYSQIIQSRDAWRKFTLPRLALATSFISFKVFGKRKQDHPYSSNRLSVCKTLTDGRVPKAVFSFSEGILYKGNVKIIEDLNFRLEITLEKKYFCPSL